ncbi:MAG: DUF2339 domain-containing protein [bacterium]|nr:DUF2339 domain-containing protein [bacterium]
MDSNETKNIQEALKTIQAQLNRHETVLMQMQGKAVGVLKPVVDMVAPTQSPVRQEKKEIDMERTIGTRWLAWVGFVSFIVGVGLFLKYAFEQGWINEIARVTLGYVGGAALAGVGELLRKKSQKYASYGNVLQGIGVAILYLVTFAAFNLYGLFGQMTAFGILVFITAIVGFFGVRAKTDALLATSFVGAYLTPVLIHDGHADPSAVLFSYLAVLALAVMMVTRVRKEPRLLVCGLLGTVSLIMYWCAYFYTPNAVWFFVSWIFALTTLFTAGRFLAFSTKPWEDTESWDFVPVIIVPIATLATLWVLNRSLSQRGILISNSMQGLVIAMYALVSLVEAGIAVVFSNRFGTRAGRAFLVAAIYGAVLAIALFLPDEPIVQTVALGLESVAIFIGGIWLKRAELRIGALAVLGFAAITMMNAVSFPVAQNFQIFLTNAFGIRFFLLVCLAIIAILYRRYSVRVSNDEQTMLAPAIFTITHVATLWLISTEISRWFSAQRVERLLGVVDKKQRSLVMGQIVNQKNIVISIFWGLYGIGALLFGFLSKSRFVRLAGLILLIVTVIKVALHDFWAFGTLYRMIVSLSLGVVLLLGAFFYHRFQDRIKQLIGE